MKVAIVLLLIPFACLAAAEPVDLRDGRPRAIEVWFESSPPDQPGQLDDSYDWPVTGWISPGPEPGRATLRIAASELERYLKDHEPVPGSVSDFVWVFDTHSGHVVSAQFSARFRQPVELPFFTARVEMTTTTHLTTAGDGGYRAPVTRFGHRVHEFCAGGEPECHRVDPHPYDPRTGYVNAVGWVDAQALAGVDARTYSPMGEAILRERPDAPATVSLGPPSPPLPPSP